MAPVHHTPRGKASVVPSGKMVGPGRKVVSGFHYCMAHLNELGLLWTLEWAATPSCTEAVFWGDHRHFTPHLSNSTFLPLPTLTPEFPAESLAQSRSRWVVAIGFWDVKPKKEE